MERIYLWKARHVWNTTSESYLQVGLWFRQKMPSVSCINAEALHCQIQEWQSRRPNVISGRVANDNQSRADEAECTHRPTLPSTGHNCETRRWLLRNSWHTLEQTTSTVSPSLKCHDRVTIDQHLIFNQMRLYDLSNSLQISLDILRIPQIGLQKI